MISQAMESVTRAYYARADLDLIMSSPAPTRRCSRFASPQSRIATSSLALVLVGPFINVLGYRRRPALARGLWCADCDAALRHRARRWR